MTAANCTRGYSRFAWLWLVAALVAASARAIEPFSNGIWLVAYLFLVGFLAQLLLGRGQAVLNRSQPSPRRRAQAVLWNGGVAVVPSGVFADSRVLVVLGGIGLLAALTLYWQSARATSRNPRTNPAWLKHGFTALIAFMAGSVFVGTALAWDRPWF